MLESEILKNLKTFKIFNGKENIIELDDCTKSNIKNISKNEYCLEIYKDNEVVLLISYNIENDFLESIPFYYLDKLDFNWGLFLQSFINNKNKVKTFINING